MNDSSVIEIAVRMLTVTGELAAPMLLTALAIGLAISLLQSITSIQEITLTFVPKMAGVALALVIAGHWMVDTLVSFTDQLFSMIPQLIGS
ncbi:MAG TPA: flagellar biosynthetic protein FliQ [Acidimicrobiales bacterium]|nr:flagellar biosynthetic protein FliQ [Acidimicrobiales bacterium]